MRFCPFCANELQDEVERCVYCGRRLPDLSPAPDASPVGTAPPPLPAGVVRVPVRGAPPAPPPPAASGVWSGLPSAAPAQRADEGSASAAQDDLPEIAPDAPPGLLAAPSYLIQVVRGRFARRKLIRRCHRLVQLAEGAEETALGDLGRAACDRRTGCPGAETQLHALVASRQERAQLEQQKGDLNRELEVAAAQLSQFEEACDKQCAGIQAEIGRTQSRLDERLGEQSELNAHIAEQERQVRSLERQRDDCRARAHRVATPAEREKLQQLAAEAAVQIGDVQQAKAKSEGQVAALQQPIADLRRVLEQQRALLQETELESATARRSHQRERRRVEQANQERDRAIGEIDREIALRELELGRALDLRRAAYDELVELFAPIDAARQTTLGLQRRIEELQGQCERIDQRAYRRGAIVALAAVLALLCVLAVIVVVAF